MDNYLFICNQGKNRSPFCARRLSSLLLSRGITAEVSYAGIDPFAPRRPTVSQVYSARLIFTMEMEHLNQIRKEFTIRPEKIINLDIQDFYLTSSQNDGPFSEFALGSVLDGLVDAGKHQEVKRILEKEEIKNRLSLAEVFQRRNILRYIIR